MVTNNDMPTRHMQRVCTRQGRLIACLRELEVWGESTPLRHLPKEADTGIECPPYGENRRRLDSSDHDSTPESLALAQRQSNSTDSGGANMYGKSTD